MDYELIPIEPGDAGNSHILRGTIVDTRLDVKTYAVNVYGKDTWIVKADVNIDGYGLVEDIIIFYHCQYSEKAGRAVFSGLEKDPFDGDDSPYLAMEGSPFVKEDRVIVLNYGSAEVLSAADMKVVGYEDGLPRQCVFQFRITRDDGTVVGMDLLQPLDGISIYQEKPNNPGSYERVGEAHAYDAWEAAYWTQEGDTWHYDRGGPDWAVQFSYNTVTQIWTVPFHNWPNFKPKNNKDFFVFIHCLDSVRCMLSSVDNSNPEYVYKTTDFYDDERAVVSKFYEAKTPYYKETLVITRTPPSEGCSGAFPFCCINEGRCHTGTYGAKTLTIKSSIPYTVNFLTIDTPYGAYKGTWNVACSAKTKAECFAEAFVDTWFLKEWDFGLGAWVGEISIADQVTVVASNGDSSNNIVANPIASEQIVTPTAYVAETLVHSINATATGASYTLNTPCTDGIQTFVIPYELMKIAFNITASPDT